MSERQRAPESTRVGARQTATQSTISSQRHHFSEIASKASKALGSAWAFIGACALVLLWMVTGPLFGFSDAWQLVINTGTTIVTFLMVFLIQNTQNRDSRAVHLKLDELIRSIHAARNQLIDLEHCTDEELERVEQEFATARDRRRSATGAVKQ